MRFTKRLAIVLIVCIVVSAAAQTKHPMTLEDLFSLKRIGGPALSPDGKWVACTITDVNLEANKGKTDIWLMPADGTGEMMKLTAANAGSYSPTWSPDGKTIAFMRGGQIWLIEISGGEARQLSHAPNGVDGFNWSPDGSQLVYSSMAWPNCDDDCRKKKEAEIAANKVTAKVATDLMFRHWSTWRTDGQFSHLFLIDARTGTEKDILPGADYDTPPFPFGSNTDYAFSPDGKEICFVAKATRDQAINTNLDLHILNLADGSVKNITEAYKGQDSGPVAYSPDGKSIAYGAMARPGFESDQVDIIVYERASGNRRNLTEKFDRFVDEWSWAPDGKSLYAVVSEHGQRPIYQFPLNGEPKLIGGKGFISGLQISPDGNTLYYSFRNLSKPSTIQSYNLVTEAGNELTPVNKALLDSFDLGKVEQYWFEGANGDKVQMYVVLPPGYDKTKKYPLLQILHGGPQQDYADLWTFDWNSQFFAARGYVVGLVCFHGTPGYGQAFTDAITKNWGGWPYEDVMKGTDFLIKEGLVDPNRMAAGGGSYGGYLTNWIATQTDRFKALVSHAGLWDLDSMYGATEELWFPEWELNGPYWKDRTYYDKWSPHRYAANMKTPMLISHGEQDFRVPVTQGLEIFTALRRQGIPAKLIYYPDEHHWVQQYQNKAFWYKEFMNWLDTWVPGPVK